jgi:NAD(P)-dependent dehydrogenase (short-subunit alcohol dehydrogenase family)
MRLQGKTAIVTGAASGIGFATAALFVAEGANVIAADLGMPELEGTIGIAADAGSSGRGRILAGSTCFSPMPASLAVSPRCSSKARRTGRKSCA